jgi:hypothetical protein
MSGTIEISPQQRWSAAGWLFDWTVRYLAEHVSDPTLAGGLREIVDDNLGWLGLDDFGAVAKRELISIITGQLVPAAQAQLPETLADRQSVIALLQELANHTADAPGS